ncbi:hypothetical protein N9A28_00040 [Sulfurimonas sp.]|nr:hypothetical protein [Sulfurimonas sp.]
MDDFKLKLILSILSAIVFSFIFILLTFTLPTSSNEMTLQTKGKNKLEKVAKSMRNR